MSDFKGRHFEGETVLRAVRWYSRRAGAIDVASTKKKQLRQRPELHFLVSLQVHSMGLPTDVERIWQTGFSN